MFFGILSAALPPAHSVFRWTKLVVTCALAPLPLPRNAYGVLSQLYDFTYIERLGLPFSEFRQTTTCYPQINHAQCQECSLE